MGLEDAPRDGTVVIAANPLDKSAKPLGRPPTSSDVTVSLHRSDGRKCWRQTMPFLVNRILVLLLAGQLSGCVNMLPPDARSQLNRSKTTYELCDALARAHLAPEAVRAEWHLELSKRGATCGSYAADRRKQDAIDDAARARFISDLARSVSRAQRSDGLDDGPATARQLSTVCHKKGEALRGFSRHCAYDCLGTEVVQTVSSAELCAISITR